MKKCSASLSGTPCRAPLLSVERTAVACAQSFEGLDQRYENVFYHADQLLKGAYALYVDEWLRAFGKKRLLLLRAEDYWARPEEALSSVFAFLGLRSMPTPEDGTPSVRCHTASTAFSYPIPSLMPSRMPSRSASAAATRTHAKISFTFYFKS